MKSQKFPEEVLKDLIEEAAKKSKKEKNQKKISSFFQQKVAPPAVTLEPEVIIETVEDDPVDEDSVVIDIDSEERFANDPKYLKELCNFLGVKKVKYLGSSISEEDNISILAEQMLPNIKTYQELSHQVDDNAKYFQARSEFSSLKDQVASKIQKTKDDLEDLVENAVLMTDGVKNISIPEKRKLLEYCLRKRSECIENLSKTMDSLNCLLTQMIRKLQKRKSNLKMRSKSGFKIISKNSDKSWDQCLAQVIEEETDGIRKFSLEDFVRTVHYFEWLSKTGNEYCQTEDLLKRLNKPACDKEFVERILLEKLPIVKLRITRGVSVLIDAEVLFTTPKLIYTLMKMSGKKKQEENQSTGETPPPKFSVPVHSRAKGSGRPSLYKKRPDCC